MVKSEPTAFNRVAHVLIVDDHPLVREGIAVRVNAQHDMQVCGEASSVDEALEAVRTLHPDVAVIDIALIDSSGLELIDELHARYPEIKMLVVSAYDEFLYAERSLRAGAHGYICKRELQEDILKALRTVLEGERYVSSRVAQRMLGQAIRRVDPREHDPIERLSNRELQVFELIGDGKTTSAIAAALHLSVHTIDTHREKIRHKLGLKNGAELMQRAVQWRLESR
ncbi:MAG: response regulator transcription factor [Planctomycetales bacterium]|nr:response regulator transcription factor [Planctomycetales bacterium]